MVFRQELNHPAAPQRFMASLPFVNHIGTAHCGAARWVAWGAGTVSFGGSYLPDYPPKLSFVHYRALKFNSRIANIYKLVKLIDISITISEKIHIGWDVQRHHNRLGLRGELRSQ
jgi:hypothetical protein